MSNKVFIAVLGFVAAVTIALLLFGNQGSETTPTQTNNQTVNNETARNTCVQHTGLGMHIHPTLQIIVEEQTIAIPANVGITPRCMKSLHTHDQSGKLHVEYKEPFDFRLGDFFAVWDKPFSKDQILDYKVDANHRITMTVNGQPSDEFENLLLKDNQQIVIRFERLDAPE